MAKKRKIPTPEELEAAGRYQRVLEGLPDSHKVGPPLAAIFLNVSEKTLARWRQGKKRKDGTETGPIGPIFAQCGVEDGIEAQNQGIEYEMCDLRKYFASLKVRTTMEGAILRGMAFSTLADCLQEQPFWIRTITSEIKGSAMGRGIEKKSKEVIVGSVFNVSEDQLRGLITDPTASIRDLSLDAAMKKAWSDPAARQPLHKAYLNILQQSIDTSNAQQESAELQN